MTDSCSTSLPSGMSEMTFDERLKELARAHDAVDRLRDLRSDLETAKQNQERKQDLRNRFVLLVMIAYVVAYAYLQM